MRHAIRHSWLGKANVGTFNQVTGNRMQNAEIKVVDACDDATVTGSKRKSPEEFFNVPRNFK